MKIRNVLLVYKKSAYAMDFLDNNKRLLSDKALMKAIDIKRYQAAHESHQQTLTLVEELLQKCNLNYEVCWRGQKPKDAKLFDLIITVGGDGTFLQAARQATRQVMLGVNSDPRWSVGRFCCADRANIERVLHDVLSGKKQPEQTHRLILQVADLRVPVLNDVLISHANPAAMSRYLLSIGTGKSESHRSSGLWVSTAAGSSSAIKSAGGKVLKLSDARYQYLPRELYPFKKERYQLTGGLLKQSDVMKITSIMHEGCVFVDGAHFKIPLKFGQKFTLKLSKKPLKIVS